MFNRLAAAIYRPERGWDPVPAAWVAEYSANAWTPRAGAVVARQLDALEAALGGFAGKQVLDLGGGPGHYSVAFAQRGADVTWHDVSAGYAAVVRRKAAEHGVAVRISVGYMDEAPRLLRQQFDLVENRSSWFYGWSDAGFARVLYALTRPGGLAHVHTPNARAYRDQLAACARLRTWLNARWRIKLGHPMPPPGRVARLLARLPIDGPLQHRRFGDREEVLFRRA